MVTGARAVVIGAGGGIGAALVASLQVSERFEQVHALSRNPSPGGDGVSSGVLDVTDEASIQAAAEQIGSPVDLVIIATGILHEDGWMPEKALRELDGAALARIFQINTIGPALVLKHFTPLLAKDRRTVVAALSARVGSISDNRSGGWYGYRASKSALNMIVKSAAIELRRSRPQAICVALHPGTVDTALSKPFQARVPADRLFTVQYSADQLLAVLAQLGPDDTGEIFAWDGDRIQP
jgi:NAD(P)-dependent dehydrogenase (short-subunit alcohol dehydrogenase family)